MQTKKIIDFGCTAGARMTPGGSTLLHLITAFLLLSGCAYREINPEAALADERANNGYLELQEVLPGTAKLVFRTAGAAYPAHFSVSTAVQACQEFDSVGNVVYAGRGIVYPWIANMAQRGHRTVNKTEPYRVREVYPGDPIQIRAYGSWADGAGAGFRSGNCGPVVARFTPEHGHAYIVEFVWGSKPVCSLAVADATQPDAPVPVPVETISDCPAPR